MSPLRSVTDTDKEKGSLHRLRRSDRGRSRGRGKGSGKRKCSAADISLKKRAFRSHLRRRRIQAPVTAASESPEEWRPPPVEESFSRRLLSNPSIRWTEEERDWGKHKRTYKIGRVFDPESDSWVVKYDIVMNPMPPWSNGIRRELTCHVCRRPGHLDLGCPLTFDYPPDAPPFNCDHYEVVCECGSNDIVPGRRSCIDCQPNSRLRVASKYPPPLIEYQNEDPDPASYYSIFLS